MTGNVVWYLLTSWVDCTFEKAPLMLNSLSQSCLISKTGFVTIPTGHPFEMLGPQWNVNYAKRDSKLISSSNPTSSKNGKILAKWQQLFLKERMTQQSDKNNPVQSFRWVLLLLNSHETFHSQHLIWCIIIFAI